MVALRMTPGLWFGVFGELGPHLLTHSQATLQWHIQLLFVPFAISQLPRSSCLALVSIEPVTSTEGRQNCKNGTCVRLNSNTSHCLAGLLRRFCLYTVAIYTVLGQLRVRKL